METAPRYSESSFLEELAPAGTERFGELEPFPFRVTPCKWADDTCASSLMLVLFMC
jgi:hypothetical protein